MTKWIIIFISVTFLGAAVVLWAGLTGSNSENPYDPFSSSKEARSQEKGDDSVIYPLTGEQADSHIVNRPLAVIINNHPEARPQSGLQHADVVYEVLSEGAVTRFVAIYQSQQPVRIGPVRSARGYHIDLANGFDAFFVTHGWSPEAERMLENNAAPYLSGLHHDGTLFQRSSDRSAPHNSYISYIDALSGLTSKGYEAEYEVRPLPFAEEETLEQTAEASKAEINYLDQYDVTYTFDQQSGSYLRATDNKKDIDLETQEPITISNILILEAPHKEVDEQGRRSIELSTGGNGILLQKGQAYDVEWKNIDGRLLPVKNGKTVPLVPGNTWINIVPSSPGVDHAVELSP
ncbi:DUF3048 domain-containing protein [Thalassorhabdus alkalitolerans]|uniref:DUF3048 domain-containing protein n=1 Tax=Thalassorhabdus alkalitolerans TaxID=2282697 RepID=A0ABW0YT34_9BACI